MIRCDVIEAVDFTTAGGVRAHVRLNPQWPREDAFDLRVVDPTTGEEVRPWTLLVHGERYVITRYRLHMRASNGETYMDEATQ